jgi:hypothetical protein
VHKALHQGSLGLAALLLAHGGSLDVTDSKVRQQRVFMLRSTQGAVVSVTAAMEHADVQGVLFSVAALGCNTCAGHAAMPTLCSRLACFLCLVLTLFAYLCLSCEQLPVWMLSKLLQLLAHCASVPYCFIHRAGCP